MPDIKHLKIACQGVAKDFSESLIPAAIKSLGYQPIWTNSVNCDLMVIGPFFTEKKVGPHIPKPLRPLFEKLSTQADQQSKGPLRLFITGENVRYDFQNCDYSISFDLGICKQNHLRMPYWMEMVDWSSEGVTGNQNPRYGRLLNIERLMQPLGNDFLQRTQTAVIFASHLREPRGTLLSAVKKEIEVVEFGRIFNSGIKNHLESGIIKYDVLQNFAFNLCPENGMYPGYYTEKIPEAFMAGCLPISWADENLKIDFNPRAFINLAPMSISNFSELKEILHSRKILEAYANEALLINKPSIDHLKAYLNEVIRQALS